MGLGYQKIILLSPLKISDKLVRDFYIVELSRHFLLEYWDFSATFTHLPHTPNVSTSNPGFELKEFGHLGELDKALAENKKNHPATLFIIVTTYNYTALPIFKLLTKHNSQTAIFARGMTPSVKLTGSIKSRIKWLASLFSGPRKIMQVASNILALHYKKTGRISPYNIIFQAGKMGIYVVGLGASIDSAAAEIVQVNHFDYDKYLDIRDNPALYSEKYAVFLDDCLPHHPDTKLLKIQTVDATEYYRSLNSFFDYIEKEHNVRVVIAAHPKSNYLKHTPFGKRQFVYGQTAELVKDSAFAIAHLSTSISFGVLFRKPVLFITNDPIQGLQQKNIPLDILGLADSLGRKVINIDNKNERESLDFKINEAKYTRYIYDYLSSEESDSRKSVDIISNYLLKEREGPVATSNKKQTL